MKAEIGIALYTTNCRQFKRKTNKLTIFLTLGKWFTKDIKVKKSI